MKAYSNAHLMHNFSFDLVEVIASSALRAHLQTLSCCKEVQRDRQHCWI